MRRTAVGPLAVAALVALGVLAAAGASRLGTWLDLRKDPARLVPTSGLLLSVAADDLRGRIEELRAIPVYRSLVGRNRRRLLARWLGWDDAVPDPLDAIPPDGPSAVGLYAAGWALVRPAAEPGTPELPQRRDGSFLVVASSARILGSEGSRTSGPIRAPDDAVVVRLDLARSLASSSRGRLAWARLLPDEAAGSVRASGGRLREIWRLRCASDCCLDLLDPEPREGCEAQGWAAIPPHALAIEWLQLSPERLGSWAATAEAEDPEGALGRIRRIERFLGVPFLAEIGAALAGPCVVAAVPGASSGTEPLFVLDLRSPDRARAVLDRVVALAVLSGSVVEEPYRGVPIATWRGGSARDGIEPSAAVDGNLLLLGLRRLTLRDAIDRRRSAPGLRSGAPLRREMDALGPGSWKAVSRSPQLLESWGIALGLGAGSPAGSVESRGVLAREGDGWVLRGDGTAPAWLADQVLPCLRRLARSLRLSGPTSASRR